MSIAPEAGLGTRAPRHAGARAWVEARANPVALAATLAVAGIFVALQPLGAPWWLYADSDAAYVSSALNLVLGSGTKFFDHPGVPLQQLAALTFEVRHWFTGPPATHAYVDGLLLHLDAARPYYRAYAVALFLAGIAVAFVLGVRLLGHWGWGAAAGLLVLGAPGLVPMSIQYRADTALPLLLLGGSLLVAEAARRRDAPLFLAAGALAGLALTMKLSAIPLFAALVVAAAWRRPDEDGLGAVAAGLRRRPLATAITAAAWVAAAVVLNAPRFPFDVPESGLAVLVLLAAAAGGWLALGRLVGRGPLHPFYGALATAVVAGLVAPVTLTIPDGLRMLPWIARGITGSGVNDGVRPFADVHASILWRFPLLYALPLIVLALGALVDGLRRRDPPESALAAGAAVAAVMAASRLVGREWYFIPAYVLAIPPTLLWLRRSGRAGLAAAAVLLALAIVPQALHVRDPARTAAAERRTAAAAASIPLRPGTIGLTPAEYAVPDTRYFELVQVYDLHAAPWPYRFLPATGAAAAFAAAEGLRPVLALDLPPGVVVFGPTTYRTLPVRTPRGRARVERLTR